jgi:hypothetical protein
MMIAECGNGAPSLDPGSFIIHHFAFRIDR